MTWPSPAARADYSGARALLNAAHRRPEGTSIVAIGTSGTRTWTTREVADRVARCAALLRAQGLGRGSRVAVCAPNGAAHLVVALACQWIGAVFVPLPVGAAPAELRGLLAHSDPDLVVTTRVGECSGALTPEDLLAQAAATAPIEGPPRRLGEDLAAIVYTSGSAGEPKGVCLSAAELWWSSLAFRTGFDYAQASQVSLACAPLSHIGGLNGTTLDVLTGGGTVVVLERFDAGIVLETIERWGVTIGFVVPTMLEALLAHPGWGEANLSTWVRPLVGGDTLGVGLAARVRARGLDPIHVWGLTESGGAGACLTPAVAAGRENAVGTPLPYVDCWVLDDDGHPVTTPGEVGHLWLGGPGTFSGYWKDGRIHHPAWRDVGGAAVFDTGDLGYRDEAGYLYVVGRRERMISTGGELVAPIQVEAALTEIAALEAAAVVGVPDPYWGQRVVAVAVSATPVPVEEVRRLLAPHLAPWKLPRRIRYVEALPLTPNGKVDYAAVTALAAQV